MKTIDGVEGLLALNGQDLGHGDWLLVDQAMVNAFAKVTGDEQWFHVDPERAAKSPLGGTIAHGFLTLSLLPRLLTGLFSFSGFAAQFNYGLDGVRFPTPVRVGSRIRLALSIKDVASAREGLRVTMKTVIELEGAIKPACVADFITLLVP